MESKPGFSPWTPTRLGKHPGGFAVSEPTPPPEQAHGEAPYEGFGAAVVYGLWRGYSHTFSRAMGETCRFEPTCSRFAVKAVDEAGIEGLLLLFARLQRNHTDDEAYEQTSRGYLLDPPENYLYWRTDAGVDVHRTALPTSQAWDVLVETRDDAEVGDEADQ